MKKYLILANNSDGLYGFRRELLWELNQKCGVVVAVPNDGLLDELSVLGCKIVEIPVDRRSINPVTDLKLMLRYRQLLRKEKPDLVITYTIKPNIYGGMVCRMRKIPYAVNITGLGTAFQSRGALRKLVTALYRVALKKAKVVFFENAENMCTLLAEGIVKENQCCLLNGAGVNTDHYAFTPYPSEDTPVRFLFMGRVMREKGIDELFAAMMRLHQEGWNCTLDVLGGYEENYADQISACTEQGWLNYRGYQKDVRPFIAESHCFVLPSWHEGMANTNLECAAVGRPVITSNIHGCKEAVLENISGLLCEPKNVDSLYEAMKRFLEMNPEERSAMGRAGRKHMEEVFDKKKVVEQTIKGLGL